MRGISCVHPQPAQVKGGSHQGSVDGSRHGGLQPELDYTFNMHGGKGDGANGDGAPYPARNNSAGSFLDDYPGDSPYGSVGGSLVRRYSGETERLIFYYGSGLGFRARRRVPAAASRRYRHRCPRPVLDTFTHPTAPLTLAEPAQQWQRLVSSRQARGARELFRPL